MNNEENSAVPVAPNYKILWAKSQPRHPLWKHLLDASAVSLALPFPAFDLDLKPDVIAFLVGLHDIGKADSGFQHQIPDFSEELIKAGYLVTADARCRHERISAKFIKNKLTTRGLNPFVADAISRTVVVHHGYWNEAGREVGNVYAEAQEQLYRMLQQVLGVQNLAIESPSNLSAFGIRLAGHVVLSDWIASNEKFWGDTRFIGLEESKSYFEMARTVAQEWIEKLDLSRHSDAGKPGEIVKHARPIQKALLENPVSPGLVIIEAPMGEGKTEAAWILAEKWHDQGIRGMYMALPTMATSESLFRRYRDDYIQKLGRAANARLVHGMAWLRDDKEPEKPPQIGEPGDDNSLANSWFRPSRRAMLVAHGVGTVDQAMLAGMNVKFGFLRLYGLSNRVLVIDEIHAYDSYMSAIIGRLLNWCACLKIPVILLSATLSAKQRAVMIEAYGGTGGGPGAEAQYPLITVAKPGEASRFLSPDASSSVTLRIETYPGLLGDARKTANKAVELVNGGGCCCVILNTVKQAQAVYKEINLNPNEKMLFHARFTASDREKITEKVLKLFGKDLATRPARFVLVATQIVEQSLDVDFDYMVSEIAPIDLLLQRSGRMHRHRKRDNDPILHMLLPLEDNKHPLKFGASEIIYQRYPLLRTLEVLNEVKGNIQLPQKFRPLIEAVYGCDLPLGASDDLKQAKQEWEDLQEDLAAQAGEFLLCEPMEDEFDPVGADEVGDDSNDGNGWRAQTRLGLEDVLVIPVMPDDLSNLAKGDLARDQVKELYQSSVKIPPYYWPPKPAKGYDQPVLGQERLKGVWLLPVKNDGQGWRWEGISKDKKKTYTIEYDSIIGLTHGGDK